MLRAASMRLRRAEPCESDKVALLHPPPISLSPQPPSNTLHTPYAQATGLPKRALFLASWLFARRRLVDGLEQFLHLPQILLSREEHPVDPPGGVALDPGLAASVRLGVHA
eukprot:scaffold5310_cov114-Isochrysis_galbana.AAC.6